MGADLKVGTYLTCLSEWKPDTGALKSILIVIPPFDQSLSHSTNWRGIKAICRITVTNWKTQRLIHVFFRRPGDISSNNYYPLDPRLPDRQHEMAEYLLVLFEDAPSPPPPPPLRSRPQSLERRNERTGVSHPKPRLPHLSPMFGPC